MSDCEDDSRHKINKEEINDAELKEFKSISPVKWSNRSRFLDNYFQAKKWTSCNLWN